MTSSNIKRSALEGKGFLFLAGILFLIAIGIVVGRFLFPTVTIDYYTLGLSAKEEKRYGEAYYYLTKAIETEPSFTEAYIELSEILVLKGRKEEAVSLLTTGVNFAESPSIIRDSLIPLLFEAKAYEDQEQNLLALLANDSLSDNNAEYTYLLGVSYLREMKLDEAQASFKQVIDHYQGTPSYYKAGLELTLFSIEDKATRNAMLVIAKDAASPVIGDAAEIEDKLAKAAQADEKNDEGQKWGWFGVLMLEQDRCELSEEYFLKGIEEGDRFGIHAGIHGYYGECLYRIKRYSEAISQSEIALSADPLLISSWETKAKACVANNDSNCIDASYSKLITVDSANTAYYIEYASALLKSEKTVEALEIYEKAFLVADDSQKRLFAENVLYLMFSLENSYENAQIYISALDTTSSEYYDYTGWMMYLNSGPGKENIEQSLIIDAYNASANYHYAELLFDEGQRNAALEYAYRSIDYDIYGSVSTKANNIIKKIENKT